MSRLVDKSEFKCKSRGMETCLHSRGAALNARETGIYPRKDKSILLKKMPYGFNRVMNNHPWSRESHNFTNLFSHVLPVAMRRTFLAGGLLFSVLA